MILNTDIIIFYIQDYHVFFMHNPSPNRCLVFDLDTTLPFPTYFHKYVTETFRSDLALRPEHHRYLTFKVDFPIYKKFKEATNTYVFTFRYTYMYKFQNYIHLHISIVSTYTCEYNNSVKSSLFLVSN